MFPFVVLAILTSSILMGIVHNRAQYSLNAAVFFGVLTTVTIFLATKPITVVLSLVACVLWTIEYVLQRKALQ